MRMLYGVQIDTPLSVNAIFLDKYPDMLRTLYVLRTEKANTSLLPKSVQYNRQKGEPLSRIR